MEETKQDYIIELSEEMTEAELKEVPNEEKMMIKKEMDNLAMKGREE